MKEFVQHISQSVTPEVTAEELLRRYLQELEERYRGVALERNVSIPDHGSWEVGLIILGDVPEIKADANFLNLLDSSNPDYTGWPVWLISRGFNDQQSRPYVYDGCWEAFIASLKGGSSDHLDFLRLDPKGRFYLYRALEDDISWSPRAPQPLNALDFALPIVRVAEALAVGLSFAKAMGCPQDSTSLSFAIKWSRLRGRQLVSWAEPGRYISPGRVAYQDDVISFVSIPLDTPLSALSEYVNQAVQPLYQVFDGFQLGIGTVEEITQRLIERRL